MLGVFERIASECFVVLYTPSILNMNHNINPKRRNLPFLESEDSLPDEVLAPLKTYKYSSVDKSFTSRYVLKHYVL